MNSHIDKLGRTAPAPNKPTTKPSAPATNKPPALKKPSAGPGSGAPLQKLKAPLPSIKAESDLDDIFSQLKVFILFEEYYTMSELAQPCCMLVPGYLSTLQPAKSVAPKPPPSGLPLAVVAAVQPALKKSATPAVAKGPPTSDNMKRRAPRDGISCKFVYTLACSTEAPFCLFWRYRWRARICACK